MEQRHVGMHHGNFSDQLEFDQIHGGENIFSMQLHGVCMVIGFWFFLPIAMVSSRYFRREMSETIGKAALWFQCHRSMALLAIGFIIIGFTSILVHTGGAWTTEKSGAPFTHSIFGLITIIGIFIQPLIALFRCHTDHPNRFIFTWFHRIFGMSLWLLSQATILLATFIPYSGLSPLTKLGNAPRAIILIYWLAISLFIGFLELFKRREKTDIPLHIENGYMAIDSQNGHPVSDNQAKGLKFKAIVWVFVISVCLLMTGLFSYIIFYCNQNISFSL